MAFFQRKRDEEERTALLARITELERQVKTLTAINGRLSATVRAWQTVGRELVRCGKVTDRGLQTYLNRVRRHQSGGSPPP